MTSWVSSKARRLLIAGSLAFAVGAPTIACMGGDTAVDDEATEDDAEDDTKDDKKKDDVEAQLMGSWKVRPAEADLRVLKIVNAAISGKPKPPKKLEPLSAEEKGIFNDMKKKAKNKKDPDVIFFQGMIKMLKGTTLTFEEGGRGNADFSGDTSPFSWSTKSKGGKNITVEVSYDHGVVEVHTITIKGKSADDHITSPQSVNLTLKRI